MPFSPTELTNAGYTALDFYMKNDPIDQIKEDRPLLKAMMAGKKSFPGAKQNVVVQIRYSYNSNFQWFNGDAEVSYNHRQGILQASYPWRACHDGFAMNEDELLQNGITIIEGKGGNNTEAERIQLTNLLDENITELRLGMEQLFDQALHRDGTQSSDALAGLDFLLPSAPTTGTVGGINRATNAWWQSNAATGISGGTSAMIDTMEKQWRACARNGGQPNKIICGETFVDAFRDAAGSMITRFRDPASGKGGYNMDPSTGVGTGGDITPEPATGLYFHGIPIEWDPVFLDLDNLLSPTIPWQKRCYFLNTNFIKLRPAEGQDMVVRKPPRVYNRYTYYWGITWRGAMVLSRSNAHSFMSIT